MPQTPDWKQFLDAGVHFVALTRTEARRRARELVATGQLAQGQVQAFVDALVDESRRRTDEMLEMVRREIQRQVRQLGLVTKDDLARMEARLTRDLGAGGGGVTTAAARTRAAKGATKAGKGATKAGKGATKARKVGKATKAAEAGRGAGKAEKVAVAAAAGNARAPSASDG